jgi:hypothetical protein
VDLEYFVIKNFATGKNNLDIVDRVPAWAKKSGSDNEVKHSMLQTFYPEGSINPGNKDAPIGGSEFYATPLPLSEATNVTLEYSVFFPQGFSWVLGGKLPGLYGGHMSCSGGNDAKTCFSTRMMWRSDGAGEVYLVCCYCACVISTLMVSVVRSKRQTNSFSVQCSSRISL